MWQSFRTPAFVFDHCGHVAMLERPGEFNALALEFLASAPP